MVIFFAVAGNSYLVIRSLIVFLTMFKLMEVSQKVAAKLLFGRGRPAKQQLCRLCRPL